MTENNELLKRMTQQYPVTVDGELMGTSIHTDDSLSKLVRRDGSPIKISSLKQTKGYAPTEFTKQTYGKNITLKYDRTKFRPDFAIAPTQENTTVIDQEEATTVAHNRSFLESVSPS